MIGPICQTRQCWKSFAAREVPLAVSGQLSADSHFLFTLALAAARSEDSAHLPDISAPRPLSTSTLQNLSIIEFEATVALKQWVV
jgi:hypothetical protein